MRVPTSYFIKNSNAEIGVNQGVTAVEQKKADTKSEYTFRVEINTHKPLTYISIPSHAKVSKFSRETAEPQAKHAHSLLIEKVNANAADLKKDICVYFRLPQMDHPHLIAQPHPEHPDEIACLVSLVPTFVPP